jgi:hypothetical protein
MNYGSESYWDERYAAVGDQGGEINYDWYVIWMRNTCITFLMDRAFVAIKLT